MSTGRECSMITIINIGNVIHIKKEAVDLDSLFMFFLFFKNMVYGPKSECGDYL